MESLSDLPSICTATTTNTPHPPPTPPSRPPPPQDFYEAVTVAVALEGERVVVGGGAERGGVGVTFYNLILQVTCYKLSHFPFRVHFKLPCIWRRQVERTSYWGQHAQSGANFLWLVDADPTAQCAAKLDILCCCLRSFLEDVPVMTQDIGDNQLLSC